MPGSSHEAMHRIFQHDPGVFARAFRALDLPFPDPIDVALLPTDLTETRPLERRVDTLLRIGTAEGDFLLLVEAQHKPDPGKPPAWAYYLAHLHSKYLLPPVLLVVCQDENTERWASGPFTIGPRQWPSLVARPLVLGPDNVPIVTDVAEAAIDVPLAALSAITHAHHPCIGAILKSLAAALRGIDDEDAAIVAELTELGLGTSPAADTWRQMMSVDLSFFRSQTSQRIREEGREEGLASGQAVSVLRVLDRRGIEVADADRERILGCADTETLTRWLDRALTAESVAEVFAE
ncbi:hypothetical protein [Nocardia higoensis]|uniref:hypothetical protein n=1 Tax=Nocardia higoensis TaxID=228599 RepID=UPI0002DB102E|nr:hypothetical protein [Nocardia higoensis]